MVFLNVEWVCCMIGIVAYAYIIIKIKINDERCLINDQ